MKSITEIKSKLQELRLLDKELEIFGASSHEYEFNQPIPLDELKRFEDKYEVDLPEDYKAFICEIGDGGAGPYYGIHPLQRDVGDFDPENRLELLKFDFPHKEGWNWTEKILSKFDDLRDDEYDEVAEFFDSIYWEEYFKDELTHGSFYITEYGCALRFLLVTTGEEKGKIWFDQRADQHGINPVLNKKGDKLDFSDWYVEWLDKSIAAMKEK